MGKRLGTVLSLHYARASIFPRVAGLRKRVITLFRLCAENGGLRPAFADCDFKRWSFICFREFNGGGFHKSINLGQLPVIFILRVIMKTVNPREIAFRDQFRLRRQPMLDLVPLPRSLVYITEIGPSGYFIR